MLLSESVIPEAGEDVYGEDEFGLFWPESREITCVRR